MARPSVLTPRATDFPRWYQDVVAKAELADNGPVRGTMVIRPYGYALWERMQQLLDARIKATGAKNAYFPLFIPESFSSARPSTSTASARNWRWSLTPAARSWRSRWWYGRRRRRSSAASWPSGCSSHRDLPLLLNQWANVVRWELRPRVFLRTSEFLWQEGHTAHVDEADASAYARRILHEVYADFMRRELAVPVVAGRKTVRERFAGAINTLTLEAMMGDGKALQMGTSHELGQNFARGIRHRVHRRRPEPPTGVDHVVGRQHPHGGWPDHDPRRRRRPAGAATAGRRPRRW